MGLTKLPKLASSIANWFEREHGEVSKSYVIKEKSEPLDDVNPYHIVIIYQNHPDYYEVLGFIQSNQPMVKYITVGKRLKSLTEYNGDYAIPWMFSTLCMEVSLSDLRMQLENGICRNRFDKLTIAVIMTLCHYNDELSRLFLPHLERQFFFETEFICESSDASVTQWIKRNEPYITQFIVTPTLMDLRAFCNEPQEPTLWFRVRLMDLPTDISKELHLYKGGVMHLPRKYLSKWIWRKMVTFDRYKKELPEQMAYLDTECRRMFRDKKKQPKEEVLQLEVQDIEDLFPPCFERIVKLNQFPKDIARNAFVRTLSRVNYPLERIGKLLDEKNEKDPHERRTLSNSLSRWDYKTVYEKKYAPVPCNLDICACPGDGLEKKKLACFEKFKTKFPDRHLKKLWGPMDWIKSTK